MYNTMSSRHAEGRQVWIVEKRWMVLAADDDGADNSDGYSQFRSFRNEEKG